MVTSTIKREIQHFGDIVVSGRPAKVQKECAVRSELMSCFVVLVVTAIVGS